MPDDGRAAPFECPHCGSQTSCDCRERIECAWAGISGHYYCGRKACGCPRFLACGHAHLERYEKTAD